MEKKQYASFDGGDAGTFLFSPIYPQLFLSFFLSPLSSRLPTQSPRVPAKKGVVASFSQ